MNWGDASAVQPTLWNVVFHPDSPSRLARLTLGRFKHVSAFAYVHGFKVWIFVDSCWGGLHLMHVPPVNSPSVVRAYLDSGCEILTLQRQTSHMGIETRLGFTCVTAVKHLLGLASVALTPDGLYKAMIRNGATALTREPAIPPNRPEPRAGTDHRAERTRIEPANPDAGRYGLADGPLRDTIVAERPADLAAGQ